MRAEKRNFARTRKSNAGFVKQGDRIMEKSNAQRQSEQQVLTHIQDLVAEEHRLLGKGALEAADHERLTKVQVELDQCWDLLRQRRALRETGGDPERAEIRPPDIVEKYVG
jgi:hypothetical protein